MLHKIKNVFPLSDFRLCVHFADGITKFYDLKPLFYKYPAFEQLRECISEYYKATVDVGGYGVIWNDNLDLSCDELWNNGIEVAITEVSALTDEQLDIELEKGYENIRCGRTRRKRNRPRGQHNNFPF